MYSASLLKLAALHIPVWFLIMDKCSPKHPKAQSSCSYGESSNVEVELVSMTEQEEDIIRRMHKLVGDRWDLIAGRVPGRTAEEIKRFWLMKNKTKKIEQRTR